MSLAAYHRATLDSLRHKLPHPERFRVALAAVLAFMIAGGDTHGHYTRFDWVAGGICFLAATWLLIDYSSIAVRFGAAFVAAMLVFAPALDPSSDVTFAPGLIAFVAAATVGALTAIIERMSDPSPTAIQTRALRDIRGQA